MLNRAIVSGAVLVAVSVASLSVSAQPSISNTDSLALISVYNATDGASWDVIDFAGMGPWIHYSGSNLPRPAAEWRGVTIQNLKVSELNLSGFGLNGTLPDDIGKLTSPSSLSIAFNPNLTGGIPLGLGNLSTLERLDLSNNSLSGTLPDTLRNLTNLKTLDLTQNGFTGSVFDNIERLTQLEYLYLSGNQLDGDLPAILGSLTSLTELNLSSNGFSGSIPTALGALGNLTLLSLSSNNLTGSVPTELGQIGGLQVLSLSNNDLSGPLPTGLGSLPALRQLLASGNSFDGSIPTSFGGLASIQDISFTSSNLNGDIPDSFRQLLTLETLGLDFNDLEGIPDLSDLPALRQLRLRGNRFDFDDLEPLAGLVDKLGVTFTYDAQQEIAGKIIRTGSVVTLHSMVGGIHSECTWYRDGLEIPGVTTLSYTLPDPNDTSEFRCEATSSDLPGLTLVSRPQPAMDSEVLILGSNPPIALPFVTVRAVGGSGEFETHTDVNGKYAFSLVPGPYTFIVEPTADDKQLRKIIEQPVTVLDGQVDYPTFDMGTINRRGTVVNWAQELQNFGNPNVIFNLDVLDPISTPYLEVMGDINLFAAEFPDAPAATTEQLYRLYLALRVVDSLADDVSDMSGDLNSALFDMFSTIVSLDTINKKLTAALGKLVSKLNQFAIGKYLLSNIELLSSLSDRSGGRISRYFQQMRERVYQALLASLSPKSLRGGSKYVLSRELLETLITKIATNAAYASWKPTDAISGTQEYLGFGSELINALYAKSTQESVIAALAESKTFSPQNEFLWDNQKNVSDLNVMARGERDAVVARITTSNTAFQRDFAGAVGGALETLADLLKPLAAIPAATAVVVPVQATAAVMGEMLQKLELFIKFMDLADISYFMYTRPDRLNSGVAMAFDKENLLNSGKRGPTTSRGAGSGGTVDAAYEATHAGASMAASEGPARFTGVPHRLSTAAEDFNHALDVLAQYVSAEDFDAYIDWLEHDFADVDDALETTLLGSDALLQSALLTTAEVDGTFMEAYSDLISETIAFDSARILMQYEMLGFLFGAATFSDTSDPGYLQIRQELFDSIDALQTLSTDLTSHRTAALELAEALDILVPTVLIESVETFSNGVPTETIRSTPQSITVRAGFRNLGAATATDLTAMLSTPDPVLDFDATIIGAPSIDHIAIPAGDLVEVEWELTYSGSLEQRSAPLHVSLSAQADDFIIPGGFSIDIGVFDSTDTDQDGMPNQFEVLYSLQVNTPDDEADADDDGLTNSTEYYLGTDPQNDDTDGDGYTDGEEIEALTNPLDPKTNPGTITASDPADDRSLPDGFALDQNYPNPFNPVTTITYTLPRAATVHLFVYDILGRQIATIDSGLRDAGRHTISFDAFRLPSGVYVYRLTAGGFSASRKMLVFK